MYLPPVAPKSPPQSRKARAGSVVVEFAVFTNKNISNVITNPLLEEEYRIDPNDGNAYSKSSFILEYGGSDEWDMAPKLDETNNQTAQILERIPFEEGFRYQNICLFNFCFCFRSSFSFISFFFLLLFTDFVLLLLLLLILI